jgi:hypothetical protein
MDERKKTSVIRLTEGEMRELLAVAAKYQCPTAELDTAISKLKTAERGMRVNQ